MSSSDFGKPSASTTDLLDFSIPVTPEDSRALDEIRYAYPLPFEEYLAFATRWSDEWVERNGMRPPDETFVEPFRL
jgi:hypothetical protein